MTVDDMGTGRAASRSACVRCGATDNEGQCPRGMHHQFTAAAFLPDAFYMRHLADFLNLRGDVYRLYRGLRAAGRTHAAARAEIKKWAGADVDAFK